MMRFHYSCAALFALQILGGCGAAEDGDVCDGAGSDSTATCVATSPRTFAVGDTSEAPQLVQASTTGGVFVVANVSGSQDVEGANIRADAEGDILVTELDPQGRQVFSTLIAGAGRQEALATATDEFGDLQLFLSTNQSIGFDLDTQPDTGGVIVEPSPALVAPNVSLKGIGLPVCVVPGSPNVPGNTTVTINRTTGTVTLVLVYPYLGSGGAWRSALQPQAETHYVYGYTPNDTSFGDAPADGSVDLVAGIYSLVGQTNCVHLGNLTPTAKGQWGSSGAELADKAIVSAGKFWLFASFTQAFQLGGANISCGATGGTVVAPVIPGVAPVPPKPLVMATPGPVITCPP